MARAKLKFSPAIADRTVKRDGDTDDEGMEAVLFHNKERRQRHRRGSRNENGKYGGSEEDDDVSAIFETPQNTDLLNLVEGNDWEKLLYRVLKEPHTAHVKFTGRSVNSDSAGNLILHEICKQDPPLDVVEAVIEANEKALSTKGNAGYLPLHYACASGASIEMILLLHSLNSEAVKAVDDAEGVLPLHLACMTGITKEEVYMCLLTSYPEGSMVRDDFGRLPIDYAKSIRGDSHRKIAIECLKRAKWLEQSAKMSRERTESEFHRRVKGYEQSQAQQLKKIEEVHTKEIAELEGKLESQKKELSERSQDLEELDQHLQEMTDDFRERVESLEKSMKAKNRKLQGEIDKAKEETTKTQVALDIKIGEVEDLSGKLAATNKLNHSMNQQLEQSNKELDLALEDIETLNKHSEWLESNLDSIRKLLDSESPVIRDSQRKNSTKSKYESTKKLGSNRKIRDSPSVSSRKSTKSRASTVHKSLRKSTEEEREPSFVSRIIGSRRE